MVLLADAIRQSMLLLTDDLHAAIGAATIDDDVLQIRILLKQYRADGLLDELGLAV
jgi:hypothetical protein